MDTKHAEYVKECLKESLQEAMCKVAQEALEESINTRSIKPVHSNVLHLKEPFLKTGWTHFLKVAKRYGTKAYVMKGLLNLERWNKDKNPEVANHARTIINKLENNPLWKKLKTKKEPELKESYFENYLSENTKNIAAIHKNVLHLKTPFLKTGWTHFLNVAKKFGTKAYVMKALLNLERWNKKRNPEVANHARTIINKLENSPLWKKLKTKKEPALKETYFENTTEILDELDKLLESI